MIFLDLLWGSIVLRPYVYLFFTSFLFFACYHLGIKRMLTFLVSTYLIAYFSEYSSTRNGFPFGYYFYLDTTRAYELWISNVPFWDSLCFVFLSYFSFVLASATVSNPNIIPIVGGILMMLLDVVIDPVALQGGKWFLGQVYFYPEPGFYFGVPLANFAGWFFVGFLSQWVFQKMLIFVPWCKGELRKTGKFFLWGSFMMYASVFIFNVSVTFLIKDYKLGTASSVVMVLTLGVIETLAVRKKPPCVS